MKALSKTLLSSNSYAIPKLGIIAAPGWIDPTAREFSSLCNQAIDIAQTIMPPVGFDYSFEQIEQVEPHLESAAQLLKEAGSEVIIQVGPAFAYFNDYTSAGARALQQRLTDLCGCQVILNGVAVLDAVKALDRRRIVLACPYYNEQWKSRFLTFLESLDVVVEGCQTFTEQGIFASQQEVDARHYHFSAEEIKQSIRQARASAPHAEMVLVGGAGVRFLGIIEELENELGVPVLSADVALHWATAKALGIEINSRQIGSLGRIE
jgi:maleate cis-trans isomerase